MASESKIEWENIFQIYLKNECRLGFYVRRNSWAPLRKARVVKIEGVVDGKMLGGEPPNFSARYPAGHPKEGKMCWQREVTLEAEWFDGGIDVIKTGGTYAWTQVPAS